MPTVSFNRTSAIAAAALVCASLAGCEREIVPEWEASPFSWSASGGQAGALLGFDVAGAGDVNGDGLDDFLVSAPKYDNGPLVDVGAVWLFLGATDPADIQANWVVYGEQEGSDFGLSIDGAGDVNDDGFDDIVIGAPRFSGANVNEGRVYIYHGGSSGPSGTPDQTIDGTDQAVLFGFAVAGVGDVDADDIDDIVVGAPGFSGGVSLQGAAFMYPGSLSGVLGSAWQTLGGVAGVGHGSSVAGFRLTNASTGVSSILVGAPQWDEGGRQNTGRATAYFGAAGGPATTASWTVFGESENALFGSSLAGIGDFNNDARGDVVVGAYGEADGQVDEGVISVFRGIAGDLETSPAFRAAGDQTGAFFGFSVAGAGDIDDDGFDDLVVGGHGFDAGQSNEGGVFVFRGNGGAFLPTVPVHSNQANSIFGSAVAGVGDVDGDGLSEVLVGAYGYDLNFVDEGRVFLYPP